MKSLFLLVMIIMSISACRVSTKAEQFVSELNMQGGTYVGNISLVKDPTKQRGYIVVYDSADGNYYAVELNGNRHFFTRDEEAYSFYMNERILVSYDKNGYWMDGVGHLYEMNQASPKDLEKMGALNESIRIAQTADYIGAQYGLSQERSISLAKLSYHMGRTAQQRTLTDADYKAVGLELLGTDLGKFSQEYVKNSVGENSDYNELLEQAARHNGISPEHMQNLIDTVVNK